jgi:hypothetical protein
VLLTILEGNVKENKGPEERVILTFFSLQDVTGAVEVRIFQTVMRYNA